MEASPLPIVGLLVNGLMAGLQAVMVQGALQPSPHLGASVWWVLGAFFMILGLIMPRVRRNPWIGVRTPWTLASDENWARTHRFAGYSFTLGGIVALLCTFASVLSLAFAALLVSALLPAVQSYRFARGEKEA